MTTSRSMSTPEEEDSEASKCEECGKKIMTKRAMLKHLDRHGSIGVSCRSCHRTFNSLSALKYHSKEFCGRRKLQCPQCDLMMPSTAYNSHLVAHQRNNCEQCPSVFTNRKNLVAHMSETHNIVILADAAYSCTAPGCDRNFVKRSSLFHHMQLRHAAQGEYVCLTCGAYVEGKEAFDAHVALHKKWTCDECGESFTRRQQFLVHKIRHERNIYRCVPCDQNLPTKLRALEHHSLGHEVTGLSERAICSECGERFYTKQELRNHTASHKVRTSVTCDQCSKSFANQGALSSHKCKKSRDDTAENIEETDCDKELEVTEGLICEQCGKHFKAQSLLDKHLNYVHRGKNLVCDFCDYRTYYDVNLRRHLALHTPQPEQFVCDQCGASFKVLSNLKDHHLFVHSDERNFQCNQCNKTFKRRNDLNRHSRSHSDQRSYVCHCQQTYKFIAHLRRHQKVAHKNGPDEAESNTKSNPKDTPSTSTKTKKTPRSKAKAASVAVTAGSNGNAADSALAASVQTPHVIQSSVELQPYTQEYYQELHFTTQSTSVDASQPNQQQTLHLQFPVSLSHFELVDQVENFMNMANGQPGINSIAQLEHDVVFGNSDAVAPSEASTPDRNPALLMSEQQDSVLISLNVAKTDGLTVSDCGGLNITCGNDQVMVPQAEMATMTEFMSHQLGLVGTQDVTWSGDLEEGLALSVFN